MSKLTITETIDAPIEQVFEVFSNFPQAAETVSGIQKIEMLTEGPVSVGTRFKETRVMFGREATEEMEVTKFEPNRFYTVAAESCGAHFESRFDFERQGNTTQVTMSLETRPLTLFAKLMWPLGFMMKGTMKKCIEADIHDLKKRCEAGSGVGV